MPSRLIDIPSDDIFKYDKLGLEPAIASRTEAILSPNPQAIAIDGHWGTGKSTFMALWAAYLRREGIKVVQFNAWKAFEADPLDVLTREILRQVDIPGPEQQAPHKRLLAFLDRYASIVAQGTKLISSFQPELEGVSQALELALRKLPSASEQRVECIEAEEARIESPEAFTALLSSAAETWSERPVVVMIDELDRCSPEYTVEMLQLLEHVFYAENVVFVVAVNHSELVHSVRSFYGQGFNAEGYLERFFDHILPLPTSDRKRYIESSFKSIPFASMSSALLFLETSGLSLREIDKAVQHLRSVLESRTQEVYALVDLWIARTLAPVEYRQFIVGEVSDKQLVDAIFAKGTCESLRVEGQQQENYVAQQLEVSLVMSSCVLPRGSELSHFYSSPDRQSELYLHYKEVVRGVVMDADVSRDYAQSVLDRASKLAEGFIVGSDVSGIYVSARLLEKEGSPQRTDATP